MIPPPGGGGSNTVQVGPLLVRPASAAGFVAQEIPNPSGPVSLAALHGSRITYLASQAMLDRVVFSRLQSIGDSDIWVCNLDGSNAVKLLDNTFGDRNPSWSPDGRRIAFERNRVGQDAEIIVMNADGSGVHAVTNNTDNDYDPTWSPEGDRLAFESDRSGNMEIWVMYDTGSSAANLTNNPAFDSDPDWSPRYTDRPIAFASYRDLNTEIYVMNENGSAPTRVTDELYPDYQPAYHPWDGRIAWTSHPQLTQDVVIGALGVEPRNLSTAGDIQDAPSWSSDGRFICYRSYQGSYDLVLREVEAPYSQFTVTDVPVTDEEPDLGSSTLQTDRVIIGPAGSDWGGANPIWSSSDAGIVAWAADGYRNFVRIGVPTNQLSTLEVTPLTGTAVAAGAPLGVVVEAADIVNLREDGGRGEPTRLWQLDPLNATAVLLYFDPQTGKLLCALVLADQVSPAAAGASGAAVTQCAQAGGTVAEGSFAAVFDASGTRVADAASEVRIANGEVTVMR